MWVLTYSRQFTRATTGATITATAAVYPHGAARLHVQILLRSWPGLVNFFKVSGALFMYFHVCDYQVNLHNNTLGADATILFILERWKLRPTEVKYITQIQQ